MSKFSEVNLCIGRSAKIETFSKLFDFYIIESPSNERISEYAYFLNLAKQLEIFEFLDSKKEGFFRQDLQGNYISGMAPKRRFL